MLSRLFKKKTLRKYTDFKFKVNQTVKVAFEENSKLYTLPTRIQDVFIDRIKIYCPSVDGRIISIEKGRKLDVNVIDNSGVGSFTTTVVDREGGAIPSLTLLKPVKVKRQQRRRSPRVKACLSVYCELLESDTLTENLLVLDEQPLWTQDISQFGVCLTASSKFPINQLVKMRITLIKPERIIIVKARILRVIEDTIYKQYLNCAEFEQISEDDSLLINQFINNNYRHELA